MKYVYVVFSSTPGKMGMLIRMLTPGAFNHVSIMFDENMEDAYTFARKYIDTPFWGGIVKDSVSRYKKDARRAYINVCRVAVTKESYLKALTLVEDMYKNKEKYRYNFFSAITSLIKKRTFVENAYTCVEFCTYVLSTVMPEVKCESFYTVADLYEIFKGSSIYEGEFNIEGEEDEIFKLKKGRRVAWRKGFLSFYELFKRVRKG
jgi:hypothetical protein